MGKQVASMPCRMYKRRNGHAFAAGAGHTTSWEHLVEAVQSTVPLICCLNIQSPRNSEPETAVVGSQTTTVVDPKPTLVQRLRLERSPQVGAPHKKSKRGVGPGPSKELPTKLLLELLPKLGISGISTGGAADDDAGAAAGAATDA